jgi:hypothetical protein
LAWRVAWRAETGNIMRGKLLIAIPLTGQLFENPIILQQGTARYSRISDAGKYGSTMTFDEAA